MPVKKMTKLCACIPLLLSLAIVLATLACGASESPPSEFSDSPPTSTEFNSPVTTNTPARNDGTLEETMRLVVIDEIAGPYLLRVGIQPADPIPGPLRVSILVQDVRGESAVDDATVIVSTSGPGTPGRVEAGNSPQHPQLYEADLILDATGNWQVTVDIDEPEKIFGGRPISMSGTRTFRIEAQSENQIQGLGSSDTQTLAWELRDYTLQVQAPNNWEWDEEFDQEIAEEIAAMERQGIRCPGCSSVRFMRFIRGHWFDERPGAIISNLTNVPPLYDTVKVWEGEVNGFPAFIVVEDRLQEHYPVNSREPSYRVLTLYVEMDYNSKWRISCSADLAESEDIKNCETIVNSVRFEWK